MNGAGPALVVTGGHSHPPELSVPALRGVLGGLGLDTVVATDVEGALCAPDLPAHRLLVVNALRWTMADPGYAEHRDRWALSLSPAAREALTDWVEAGRPLLALHTALVCFDDWPGWGRLIGGAWDWSRSSHPPVGAVGVRCDPHHPATAGLGPFEVEDECYRDLRLEDDVEVVATATVDDDPPQPAAWVRRTAGVRVATSTLGHDQRSLDHPAHRSLLTALGGWLLSDPHPEREP